MDILVPIPKSIKELGGSFIIDKNVIVYYEGYHNKILLERLDLFINQINELTTTSNNFHLFLKNKNKLPTGKTIFIMCNNSKNYIYPMPEDDESYTINVTNTSIKIVGKTVNGTLHGISTLIQLMNIKRKVIYIPCCEINDKPLCWWRGLMVDTVRHFIPIYVLERIINDMSKVKLNVLHLHLSDDQGFRFESKKFPKLHGINQEYYSQTELKKLVKLASIYGIRIVPEFDIPGHSTPFIVAYPELSSGYTPTNIPNAYGIFRSVINPIQQKTYDFFTDFFSEVVGVFQDPYIHLGGDETVKLDWDENTKIEKFKDKYDLTNKDLQLFFVKQMYNILSKFNKKIILWDENMHEDLIKISNNNSVIIQRWRRRIKSYNTEYIINSEGNYLDKCYHISDYYRVSPFRFIKSTKETLGGEACIWTELVDKNNIESRIWPNACAVAERLWSPMDKCEDIRNAEKRILTLNDNVLGFKSQYNNSHLYYELLNDLPDINSIGNNGNNYIKSLTVVMHSIETTWGGFSKEHSRSTLVYDNTMLLNKIADYALPYSPIAKELYDLCYHYIRYPKPKNRHLSYEEIIFATFDKITISATKIKKIINYSSRLLELKDICDSLILLAGTGRKCMEMIKEEKTDKEWCSNLLSKFEIFDINTLKGTYMSLYPVVKLLLLKLQNNKFKIEKYDTMKMINKMNLKN
jgi:hypothetical protein